MRSLYVQLRSAVPCGNKEIVGINFGPHGTTASMRGIIISREQGKPEQRSPGLISSERIPLRRAISTVINLWNIGQLHPYQIRPDVAHIR